MAGGGVERAKLDEGRQSIHAAIVDEKGSPSGEFFAFAPRPAEREDRAG